MKENFPVSLAIALFRAANFLDAVIFEPDADEIIEPGMELAAKMQEFLDFIGFKEETYFQLDEMESDLFETGQPVTVIMGEMLKPEYFPDAMQFSELLFVRGLDWDEGEKIEACLQECLLSKLNPSSE